MVIAVRMGSDAVSVRSSASPLAELLACLHVIAAADHHPGSRGWLQRISPALDDGLRSDLHRFAPLWVRFRTRLMYPLQLPEVGVERTLDGELADLLALDERSLVEFAADSIRGRVTDWDADPGVRTSREWVRESEARSFARGDLAHAVVTDPQRFRRDLLDLLERCARAFFAEEWQRSEPLLLRAAHGIAERLATEPVVEVVASLSDIASTRGSGRTVYFDKLQQADVAVHRHGLVLVPSLRARPHLIVKTEKSVATVVHYPVRGPEEPPRTSADLLRRRLLVLSEPARFELCRHLVAEPATTSELASRTGASKFTVSRHLSRLREVGLVSSVREGRQVFHRLDVAAVLRLGPDVLEGIIR